MPAVESRARHARCSVPLCVSVPLCLKLTTSRTGARAISDQINVGKLDPVSGTFTGESDVYALAGYLRGRVRSC